jgi:SanA protein
MHLTNLNLTSLHLLKKLLWLGFNLLALTGIIMAGCNVWIDQQTKDRLYSNLNAVPPKKVALVLGTVKRLSNGRVNRYFQYRIEATVQLYNAGKIKHILVSGDNRSKYYNEPIDMRKALMAQGIPAEAITLDYAGLRTLDSVVRAKEVFSQDDFIIVSQTFHNQRALFICDFYKIHAIGFNAEGVPLNEDLRTPIREYLARFRAVLDLYLFKTQPRFLGEKVEIVV